LHLQRLRLRHFRTYDSLDLRLDRGVTVLHGPNAVGKTNVLEAIFALATTKSFRTRTDRDLIAWGEQPDSAARFARIEGDADARGGPVRVEMTVAESTSRGTEPVARKQFKTNGRPRRASEVVGTIKAVLFTPDDVDLVTGSPSQRRRYMDLMLCQIDHRYLRLLQDYARIVTQRNALLQRLRGHEDPASLLDFWDEKLIAAGAEIITARKSMLRILNDFAREAYADVAGIDEQLTIVYRPSLEAAADAASAELGRVFRERLDELQTKEICQSVTLTGPHRDDLQFLINGADAQYFGSRGQQRSIALALRLGELRYMTNRTGEEPILLLDEALAELDDSRRDLLLHLIESYPQVIATTSHLDAFPATLRDRASLRRVSPGHVETARSPQARAS